jgi:hypothetical protein
MSKIKEKPINRYTADSSNYLKTSHRDDTSQLCCGVVHSIALKLSSCGRVFSSRSKKALPSVLILGVVIPALLPRSDISTSGILDLRVRKGSIITFQKFK